MYYYITVNAMKNEKLITVKEVFERLVALEVRLDEMKLRQDRTTARFTWFVVVLVILNVLNIFVHLLLMKL